MRWWCSISSHKNGTSYKDLSCLKEKFINKEHDITTNSNDKFEQPASEIKELLTSLCNYIESLGDDINSTQLKHYLAYRKIKNFVCIKTFNKQLKLFLPLNPSSVELIEGFSRDVRNIGHHGTGDLEVFIRTPEDLEKAKPLIERAYNEG